MRKIAALTIFLFIVLALACPALAAPAHKAVFVVGQESYTVDGQPKEMDAAPFIENGRTFVPVRYLAYALGVAEENIVWVGETGTSVRLRSWLGTWKPGCVGGAETKKFHYPDCKWAKEISLQQGGVQEQGRSDRGGVRAVQSVQTVIPWSQKWEIVPGIKDYLL